MNLLKLISVVSIFIFSGCNEENQVADQDSASLAHQEYSIDSDGSIIDTEFEITDFTSASECAECHVQHYNEWSKSFHSEAFNDPVFMSLWSLEKSHRPTTGVNYCSQCHAPAAFVSNYDLSNIQTVDDVINSDLPDIIKEGISCDICHTRVNKSPSVYTEDHVAASAEYYLNPEANIKYGSIQNPDTTSFHESMFLPIFNSSSSCKPCHNQFIRGMPIEATFSEWDDHPGLSMGGISCQSCHMKKQADGHSSHYFTGVDVLFYNGADESSEQYQRVTEMLQEAALISIENTYIEGDMLHIPVFIENLTGHNLPSGTAFSREAWIELVVLSSENDTVYSKGTLVDSSEPFNYEVLDPDLMLYTTILYDEENNVIHEVQNSISYDDKTLRTRFYDSKNYSIDISDYPTGPFTIKARMRFRTFKPQIIILTIPESILDIPIFEMCSQDIIIER